MENMNNMQELAAQDIQKKLEQIFGKNLDRKSSDQQQDNTKYTIKQPENAIHPNLSQNADLGQMFNTQDLDSLQKHFTSIQKKQFVPQPPLQSQNDIEKNRQNQSQDNIRFDQNSEYIQQFMKTQLNANSQVNNSSQFMNEISQQRHFQNTQDQYMTQKPTRSQEAPSQTFGTASPQAQLNNQTGLGRALDKSQLNIIQNFLQQSQQRQNSSKNVLSPNESQNTNQQRQFMQALNKPKKLQEQPPKEPESVKNEFGDVLSQFIQNKGKDQINYDDMIKVLQDAQKKTDDYKQKQCQNEGSVSNTLITQATSSTLPTAADAAAELNPQVRGINLQKEGPNQSYSLQHINKIVQKQHSNLMKKHHQNQQIIMSNDIYKNNQQLQKWLEENWLIGSLCIKMIVDKQIEHIHKLGVSSDEKSQGQPSNQGTDQKINQTKLAMEAIAGLSSQLINDEKNGGSQVGLDKESSNRYLSTLLELGKIQEENQSRLANVLQEHINSNNNCNSVQKLIRENMDELNANGSLASPDSLGDSNPNLVGSGSNEEVTFSHNPGPAGQSDSKQGAEVQVQTALPAEPEVSAGNQVQQDSLQQQNLVKMILQKLQSNNKELAEQQGQPKAPVEVKPPQGQNEDMAIQNLLQSFKQTNQNFNTAPNLQEQLGKRPFQHIQQVDCAETLKRQKLDEVQSFANGANFNQGYIHNLQAPTQRESDTQFSFQKPSDLCRQTVDLPVSVLQHEIDCSDSNTSMGQGEAGLVVIPIRRSNRNLSYEQQIMRTLREVLGEKELTEIRDSILEGTKKYQEKLGQVIIEQNLPRKNHDNAKNNFRGSKYRGPSKNRKKWQVMKMINKATVRIGAIKTELEAARIYDFLAILTEGLNAKTNFAYNIEQLQIIIKEFYFKDQNSIGRLKASDLNHQFEPKNLITSKTKGVCEAFDQLERKKDPRTLCQLPEQFRDTQNFALQLTTGAKKVDQPLLVQKPTMPSFLQTPQLPIAVSQPEEIQQQNVLNHCQSQLQQLFQKLQQQNPQAQQSSIPAMSKTPNPVALNSSFSLQTSQLQQPTLAQDNTISINIPQQPETTINGTKTI